MATLVSTHRRGIFPSLLPPQANSRYTRQNSYKLYHLKTYSSKVQKVSYSKLIEGEKLSQGHLILEQQWLSAT